MELVDDLVEMIFGLNKKKGFEQRRKAINEFKKEVIGLIDRRIPLQRTEAQRQRLEMMKSAVSRSIIRGYPSDVLAEGDGFVKLGENKRLMFFDPKTRRRVFVSPSIISVPQSYIFRNDKLIEKGKMTLLHELSHTITPDEFAADSMAARMAIHLGISKPAIIMSLVGRGGIIGRDKARGLMERVIAARERKMPRKPIGRLRPRLA